MRISAASFPIPPNLLLRRPSRPTRPVLPEAFAQFYRPIGLPCPIRPIHRFRFVPRAANNRQRLEQRTFSPSLTRRNYLYVSVINPLPRTSYPAPFFPTMANKGHPLEQLTFFAYHSEPKTGFADCADYLYSPVIARPVHASLPHAGNPACHLQKIRFLAQRWTKPPIVLSTWNNMQKVAAVPYTKHSLNRSKSIKRLTEISPWAINKCPRQKSSACPPYNPNPMLRRTHR